MAIATTPAILLRSHPYSETSLILRLLSEDYGLVGVIAKGARRGGGRASLVADIFSAGSLTLYLKKSSGLHTMKGFDVHKPRRPIARDLLRFAGASLLGEIVLRHAGGGPSSPLFASLDLALDDISSSEADALVPSILAHGWGLVSGLGYEPVVPACVSCSVPLKRGEMGRFDFPSGGVRCERCSGGFRGPRVGPVARAQLEALLRGEIDSSITHRRAHLRLLGNFVVHHLSEARGLRSLPFLMELIPAETQ